MKKSPNKGFARELQAKPLKPSGKTPFAWVAPVVKPQAATALKTIRRANLMSEVPKAKSDLVQETSQHISKRRGKDD